jgi:bacterial/archaeal transporter family-2 protein
VLDHFGWLGAAVRPLDGPRALGLAVVMLGVWLTVR